MTDERSIVTVFTGMSSFTSKREYNANGECGDTLTIHYDNGDVQQVEDSKCEGYYKLMAECQAEHTGKIVLLKNCFGGTGGPQRGFALASNLSVENQTAGHQNNVMAIVTVNGVEDETFYAEVQKTMYVSAAPADLVSMGLPRPSWMAD